VAYPAALSRKSICLGQHRAQREADTEAMAASSWFGGGLCGFYAAILVVHACFFLCSCACGHRRLCNARDGGLGAFLILSGVGVLGYSLV